MTPSLSRLPAYQQFNLSFVQRADHPETHQGSAVGDVAPVWDAMIVTANANQHQAEDDDRQSGDADQHEKERSAPIGLHLFMRRAHRVRAFAAFGHRHPGRGGAKTTFAHILQRGLIGLRTAFFGARAI